MAPRAPFRALLFALAGCLGALTPLRQASPDPAPDSKPVLLTKGLRIGPVAQSARSIVHRDPIEARFVAGTWKAPAVGEVVRGADGKDVAWEAVEAGPDGSFDEKVAARGGYLFFRVPSERERVAILETAGSLFVYVNGELRPGDPYGYGSWALPVKLRAGDNELVFGTAGRGLRVSLSTPPAAAYLVANDATLPDVRRKDKDREGRSLGAAVILNATEQPLAGVVEVQWAPDGGASTLTSINVEALPLSRAKFAFLVPLNEPEGGAKADLQLTFVPEGSRTRGAPLELEMRVRGLDEVHRRTFASRIDGSVQSFAVNPPPVLPAEALVLSLHGAGVDALSQAEAYGRKPFEVIVCPTNRRPYGFDWEDWGREDALEVLGLAWESLLTDKSRVYLTGHSMGGHGTWQLGSLAPDQFAAIGPSAGWASFRSYVGEPAPVSEDRVEALLAAGSASSDTFAYLENLEPVAIYALHGIDDDNVPITEMRGLVERLKKFHGDLHVHEQEKAGHWWDLSSAPGADCVDWRPMFDLFARRRIPAWHDVTSIHFKTPSPGVRRSHYWLGVERAQKSSLPIEVRIEQDLPRRRFAGTTSNAAALSLGLEHLSPGQPVEVELDGTLLTGIGWPEGEEPRLRFERAGDAWKVVPRWTPGTKNPQQSGLFKSAFDHSFVLVYGTHGTPEENAWARTKVRYDAESWLYRANGAVDVLSDDELLKAPANQRSVILYGHSEMNSAWAKLLSKSPVQVRRGEVRIGDRTTKGEGLACLFVRPLQGGEESSVGVVAGTGMPGLRLCDQIPYFRSGAGLPDCTLISTEMLTKGSAGVLAAGFFGPDWAVESGEWAWR